MIFGLEASIAFCVNPKEDETMASIEVDWDRYAEQYDPVTIGGSNPAYLELVAKATRFFAGLELKRGSLVADLGGGTGNFTLPIAEIYPDSRFVIVDQSEVMLQKAREKAEAKGLDNVDVVHGDVEDIEALVETYGRPLSHVLMIHSLYATGSLTRPEKPSRILRNICKGLADSQSRFFLADINRPHRLLNWMPYCLWHAYKTSGSVRRTIRFLTENNQARLASKYTDIKQRDGSFLVCTLDELVQLIREAGFSEIYYKSDEYFRGRDNLVIAGK